MILANITLQNLKNIYNKEGTNGIVNLLSKKNDGVWKDVSDISLAGQRAMA